MVTESSSTSEIVIRLFAGWAESELWHGGPIPYEDARLDPLLVTRLHDWARECHRTVLVDNRDSATDTSQELAHRGIALAKEVAQQLGDGFIVEMDDPTSASKLQLRGRGRAANPDAAAALRARADATHRRHDTVQQLLKGGTGAWVAYNPIIDAGADH